MTMFRQKGWIQLKGEPYPKELRLTLWPSRETGEEPKPYEKGTYELSPESFSVNGFAELRCDPKLTLVSTK